MLDFSASGDFYTLFFYILIVLVAVQAFFYVYFFARIIFYRRRKRKNNTPAVRDVAGVSLVLLSEFLEQQEVEARVKAWYSLQKEGNTPLQIVIPSFIHYDSDAVQNKTKGGRQQRDSILIVHLHHRPKDIVGDKYPIAIGIKSAKYDYITHSRAQCLPLSSSWTTAIKQAFEKGKDIIVGYTKYKKIPSFLNRFMRFENAHHAMFTLSCALAKMPISGDGRNMAYTREAFYKHKGFSNFNKMLGGEDNLFINQIADARNVEVLLDESTFVCDEMKYNFEKWIYFKGIHISTLKYYKFAHLALIALYAISQILFSIAVLVFLFSPFITNLCFLYLILGRYVMQFIIVGFVLKRLREKDLITWIPIMDFVLTFYYLRMIPQFFTDASRNEA